MSETVGKWRGNMGGSLYLEFVQSQLKTWLVNIDIVGDSWQRPVQLGQVQFVEEDAKALALSILAKLEPEKSTPDEGLQPPHIAHDAFIRSQIPVSQDAVDRAEDLSLFVEQSIKDSLERRNVGRAGSFWSEEPDIMFQKWLDSPLDAPGENAVQEEVVPPGFVVCPGCRGQRKVSGMNASDTGSLWRRCQICNGAGMVERQQIEIEGTVTVVDEQGRESVITRAEFERRGGPGPLPQGPMEFDISASEWDQLVGIVASLGSNTRHLVTGTDKKIAAAIIRAGWRRVEEAGS